MKTKYIPRGSVGPLNAIAAKNGKRSLKGDCEIMSELHNVPILFALPGVDQAGWVRCQIPTAPDCEETVFLDIRREDFDGLPIAKAQ